MAGAVGVGKGPRSDINVTPLVDVVLVLLIIFMVLTPLLEKELSVNVPVDDTNQPTPPPPPEDAPKQIIMQVKEDGRVLVNGEQLTEANKIERLKVWFAVAKAREDKEGPPIIFFDADDKTHYKEAIKALDAIKESTHDRKKGWTIGMMTEKIRGEAAAGGAGATPGAPGAAPDAAGTPAPPAPAPEPPK